MWHGPFLLLDLPVNALDKVFSSAAGHLVSGKRIREINKSILDLDLSIL